jgi:hypothetical protein
MYGPNSNADSIHMRFNGGAALTPSGGLTIGPDTTWGWSDTRFNITVPAANTPYTLTMTPREDGTIIDHITIRNVDGTPSTGDFSRYCYNGNPRDFWAASYVREINVNEATTVNMTLNSNDGHRVYIAANYSGGTPSYNLIANAWGDTGSGNRTTSTNYNFPAGTHLLRVDYASKLSSDDSASTTTPNLRLTYTVTGVVFHSDKNPNGNTPNFFDSSLMLEEPIRLTGSTAGISWWDRYRIGAGDSMIVEVSVVGGDDPAVGGSSTWTRVYERIGGHEVNEWRQRFVDLSSYIGQNIVIRFRLSANNNTDQRDGWFIDDIVVAN